MHGTSFQDFAQFIKELHGIKDTSDCSAALPPVKSFYNRAMLHHIENISRNLHTNKLKKKMLVQCRTRAADDLTDPNLVSACTLPKLLNRFLGKPQETLFGQVAEVVEHPVDSLLDLERMEIERIRDLTEDKPLSAAEQYLQKSVLSIHQALGSSTTKLVPSGNDYAYLFRGPRPIHASSVELLQSIDCDALSRRIKNKKVERNTKLQSQEIDSTSNFNEGCLRGTHELFNEWQIPDTGRVTTCQIKVLQAIKIQLEKIISFPENSVEPIFMLVLGAPGVGKTWVIQTIQSLMDVIGIDYILAASTGAAAALVLSMQTLHTLLNIPIYNESDSDKPSTSKQKENGTIPPLHAVVLASFRVKYAHVKLVFIDEMSMVFEKLLANTNSRLQQIFNSNLPFGGRSVIFFADFYQNKPVATDPLYTSVLKAFNIVEKSGKELLIEAKFPELREATKLFSKAQLFNLVTQVRAANDLEQKQVIEAIRDFSIPQPISPQLIHKLVGLTLTPKDYAQEPAWYEAPVCVTTNSERFHLIPHLAIAFAQHHKVPLVAWKKSCSGTLFNCLQGREDMLRKVYTLDSDLVGLFVKYAPGVVNENVNPAIGIANGTMCRMHSLAFCSTVNQDTLDEVENMINAAGPGEVIWLPHSLAPKYINVELELTPEYLVHVTDEDTLVAGKFVVPLPLRSKLTTRWTLPFSKGKAVKYRSHKVDLAFVMTYYKIQGKTLPKIILQLNERVGNGLTKLNFQMLTVALSRVECFNNMRIMPLYQASDLSYLTKLTHDINLKVWLNGFDDSGKWDAERCKKMAPITISAFHQSIQAAKQTSKLHYSSHKGTPKTSHLNTGANKSSKIGCVQKLSFLTDLRHQLQARKRKNSRMAGPSTLKTNKSNCNIDAPKDGNSIRKQLTFSPDNRPTKVKLPSNATYSSPKTLQLNEPTVHTHHSLNSPYFLGLVRPGGYSTCFLNATIQALSCCYPFNNNRWITRMLNKSSFKGCKRKLLELFNALLYPQGTALFPAALLSQLQQHFFPAHAGYNYSTQMDAHEFLTMLLDKCPKPYDPNDADPCCSGNFCEYLDRHFSIKCCRNYKCLSDAHDPVEGFIYSTDMPRECALQLQVIGPDHIAVDNIQTAFTQFCADDFLDDYRCTDCHQQSIVNSFTQVKQWPLSTLVLQLKLFATNGLQSVKLCPTIHSFSDLEYICHTASNFQLAAIVCHRGDTIQQGHYITYIRSLNARVSGITWYCIDDHSVIPCANDALPKNHTPYLLFYNAKTCDNKVLAARTELYLNDARSQLDRVVHPHGKLKDCHVDAFIAVTKLLSTSVGAEDIYVLPSSVMFSAIERKSARFFQTQDFKSSSQLFQKNIWLFPVVTQDHWYLIKFDRTENTVYVLNSMFTTTEKLALVTADFDYFLRIVGTRHRRLENHFNITVLRNLPTQPDVYSCGVYVCWYAEQILNGLPPEGAFNIRAQRQKIHDCIHTFPTTQVDNQISIDDSSGDESSHDLHTN